MGKAKSSKNKDDKKKKKSLNKELIRNSKKESELLKSLKTDHSVTPVSKGKSLNSLKKIKKQLNKILASREAEEKQLKALKDKTTDLSQQLKLTEANLSQYASNDDVQKINALLEQKNLKFKKKTQQISTEIELFKDLNHRVEQKIQALEDKEALPSAQQWQSLTDKNDLLYKKIHYFEEALNQFADTYIAPEQDNSKFDTQIKQLSNTITQLNQQLLDNHQTHDTQIKLLQTDTGNIRKSLQRDIKNHQKLIDNHHQGMKSLKQKISSIKDNVDDQQQQLKSIDGKLSAQSSANTATEQYQQLLSPLEDHLEALENKVQQLQQEYSKQQLETESETSSEEHNDLVKLRDQQQEINAQVEQFNKQLHQTQEDFKQQILQLTDTATKADDNQLPETLEQLNQQIFTVSEQADKLQNLFDTLQEQQSTENAHHDELAKQYLSQQQQLEKHNTQLLELLPVMSQSEQHEQQLQQLADSLAELTQHQNNLTEHENESQHYRDSIDALLKRQDEIESHQQDIKSHQRSVESHQQNFESHQQNFKSQQDDLASRHIELDKRQNDIENHHLDVESQQRKIVSYQQDQGVSLKQLDEQLKNRSRWFTAGLLTVLAVSTLLIFNQDQLQTISHGDNEQALVERLKTAVTNETFTKINALTRQNSEIINKQFTQLRKSIEQIRQETQAGLKTIPPSTTSVALDDLIEKKLEDKLEAKITAKVESLQKTTEKTQKIQQQLNKTVQQLALQVSSVDLQIKQIQQAITAQPSTAQQQSNADIKIIQLATNTPVFYTIQLLGARQKESIISFLKQNSLSNEHKIYQVELQGQPWYILVQGHFSSFAQAKEKLQQLPEIFKKNGSWVKKLP